MLYRFILSGIAMLMLAACSNSQKTSNADDAVDAEMALIDSLEEEARWEQELQARIEANPDLAKLRDAAFKLSEYIRLDGDRYVLDITEEEASKIGVDSEAYNYQLGEITKVNEIIAAAKAKGDSIELTDPQKLWKEHSAKNSD